MGNIVQINPQMKKTYSTPTAETVEVKTKGIVCQSPDATVSARMSGYEDGFDYTWTY